MTRDSNSEGAWGPCVDDRGRRGSRAHADLKISVHGDAARMSSLRGDDRYAEALVRAARHYLAQHKRPHADRKYSRVG